LAQFIPSVEAHKYLRAKMAACSWDAGWRSVLLRAYDDPPQADEFITPATRDHLIVLVTEGVCNVEVRYRGGWIQSLSRRGHIGMTAPGEVATLRWRGETSHSTLQLHLPESTLNRVAQELPEKRRGSLGLSSGMGITDALVCELMLNLNSAFRAAAPDLYAETAGELLAAHLLVRSGRFRPPSYGDRNRRRLLRVEAFMRENLALPLSLDALARQAGVSRFHLLRLYKQTYGETPLKQLTRLRMEEAKRLLRRGNQTVTAIAALCGYENSSHFATAFRRVVGVSPRSYRE
jgi:AraC family transcriptional regulator